MPTKIKDQATAERAALKVNEGIEMAVKPGEPPAPMEKTTTEKLFPDFVTDDRSIVNRPVRSKDHPVSTSPAAETLVPAFQGQTPPATPPTAPVYLDPKELTGKMVKLKVDGIEQDVPADTLIKTNQLERHLNAQLMRLAQDRAEVEADRKRLSSQIPVPALVPEPVKPPSTVKKTPEIEALESRIAQMELDRARERELLLPQIQEAGIKRVEKMAKERLGTDDFRNYFERIRDNAIAEMGKPENAANPQARAYLDSDSYYFQSYSEMKVKDLMSKLSAPASPPITPVLMTPEGAPVIINNAGQPVSIPSFESSSGVPSKVSPDASWQSTYNALLFAAKESGTQDAWMALYRHKMRPAE